MSIRPWHMRIEDILEAINAIEEYTSGMDYAAWEKDRKTITARSSAKRQRTFPMRYRESILKSPGQR